MFDRICAVCNKPMGNSLNRENYKIGEPEGRFVDVHVRCIKEFNKNPSKFANQKESEVKIDKKIIKELLDYTWTLEEQMRSELLENFMKLSTHKSEVDKIRDKLMEIELSLNQEANQKESEVKG